MDLSPGLNVIIGPSHNGKTAIIRAMRKVLYDLPVGADFINFDGSECELCLEMDTGTVWRIVHAKNGKIGRNEYRIKSPSSDETFAGFGRTVPKEVIDLTGVDKLTVGGDVVDLVFSSQLDAPFFVKRGSVWAKLFGRATGVDILDLCAKEAKGQANKAKQASQNHSDEVKTLTERHREISESVEEEAGDLQEMLEKSEDLQTRIERLSSIFELIAKGRDIRRKTDAEVDRLEEMEKQLVSERDELNTYLRSSDLCPYSGATLPEECVEGIQKRVSNE